MLYRASRGDKTGDAMYKKFNVMGTPTDMLLGPDGTPIDWIVGYDPPPDKYRERVEKSLKGIDTYQSLSERYSKEPKNVEVVFKLGRKFSVRYDPENQKKAVDLFQQVIAIDPEGKMGTTTTERDKLKVTYTEYAEFSLSEMQLFGMKGDAGPLKAFITKYPKSELQSSAYEYLGSYYQRGGTKEEAARFFEDYVAKYPQDPGALNSYVLRIIQEKTNVDKGIELGERIRELTKYSPVISYQKNLAALYILKGDKAKAEELYGKDFMDGRFSRLPFDLMDYANFWTKQKANTESAVEMAELALKLRPDNTYLIQSVANIYCQVDRSDKALQIFGPDCLKKHQDEANFLAGYANFWSGQGKNLESALDAAKRTAELSPDDFYSWFVLGGVYQKLNRFEDALKAEEKALSLAEADKEASWLPRIKQKIEEIKKAMSQK